MPLLFAIFLAFAIIAIRRSTRKLKTAGMIALYCVIGIVLGIIVGWADHNAAEGGTIAGLSMMVLGIGCSIREMRDAKVPAKK